MILTSPFVKESNHSTKPSFGHINTASYLSSMAATTEKPEYIWLFARLFVSLQHEFGTNQTVNYKHETGSLLFFGTHSADDWL